MQARPVLSFDELSVVVYPKRASILPMRKWPNRAGVAQLPVLINFLTTIYVFGDVPPLASRPLASRPRIYTSLISGLTRQATTSQPTDDFLINFLASNLLVRITDLELSKFRHLQPILLMFSCRKRRLHDNEVWPFGHRRSRELIPSRCS